MLLPAIKATHDQQGRGELAAALRARRHDGLRRPADLQALDAWRVRLASGNLPPRGHPVLFHDRGLRLATQFKLDVARLNRIELADLTLRVLDHLVEQALLRPPSTGKVLSAGRGPVQRG